MSKALKGKGALPRLQTSWDMRAACNFIGGGTGTGLLIATAGFAWLGLPYFSSLLAGLGFIAFGLFMVWLEIGRPWRSMNLFFHPQTSWMTREGILAIPIFALGALALFAYPMAADALLVGVLGLLAVGYLFCQAQMLLNAKGIPSWANPALAPYIMVTGLAEGVGVAICFPALAGRGVLAVFVLLLVARLLLWSRYQSRLQADKAPQASCETVAAARPLLLMAGHVTPLLLLLLATLVSSLASLLVAAAGLIAAAMGWYSKVVVITRAAQTRGFAIPKMPVRGKSGDRLSNQGW
jgi:phenylacetyl-CoA:acceptor oxidoreductase subunit 2